MIDATTGIFNCAVPGDKNSVPHLLRSSIESSVQELRERAFVAYGVDINPSVAFSVKGMTAAYAVFETQVLDFNLPIALRHREVVTTSIVGHEFIHLLAHEVHGHTGHAAPWKELMREFGFKPEVSYDLDVSGIAGVDRKEKLYLYKCSCTTRFITREMHKNFAASKRVQVCPDCNTVAKCTNDRAAMMAAVKPGTKAAVAVELIASYVKLGVPQEGGVLLLMDTMKLSYATARSYYFKYRPLE
ncbi:hypothetical protein D3C75_842140 [compost metagenome]